MSNSQKLNELMKKLNHLFTQPQSKPDEKKSLKDFIKIREDLEALLFKNGMSKSDIKKYVEAIIDALKSERPQETAFSNLFKAVNELNVLKEAVPRPQAMENHELSENRSRSPSNMKPVPPDKSVERAKIAEEIKSSDLSQGGPS